MSITQQVRLTHAKGFEGQEGDLQTQNNVSKVNKTTAVIPFGAICVRDGQDGVKPMESTSTASDVIGVAVRAFNDVTVGEAGINPKHTGTVKTMGTVWVKVGEDVTAGGAVYAGTGTDVLGKFMAKAGATTTLAVALPGWKYLTDATKDDVALVSINVGG